VSGARTRWERHTCIEVQSKTLKKETSLQAEGIDGTITKKGLPRNSA